MLPRRGGKRRLRRARRLGARGEGTSRPFRAWRRPWQREKAWSHAPSPFATGVTPSSIYLSPTCKLLSDYGMRRGHRHNREFHGVSAASVGRFRKHEHAQVASAQRLPSPGSSGRKRRRCPASWCDNGGCLFGGCPFRFSERRSRMPPTSAQAVAVPERAEEKVERPASPRFSSPKPQPEPSPFVIKLMGTVPN